MDDDQYGDDQFEQGGMDQPDEQSQAMTQPQEKQRQRRRRDSHMEDDEPDASLSLAAPSTSGSSALSSIHASYLAQIRSLQKTNASLQKKVNHLVALQGEHTRMKLIARQQRLLREKQMLVDALAELLISRGGMSAEELAAHLQQLIEQGALDQPNPAMVKKELLEGKQEQQRMQNEIRCLKRQVRQLEAGASGGQPPNGTSRAMAYASASASRQHNDSLSDPDRAHLSTEFLSLTAQHTALQSAHHSLTLSLAEHRKLIESVTDENRSLRAYLTQWEASEDRRVAAEQSVLALQKELEAREQEREHTFQEVRLVRSKLLALAEAKAAIHAQANQAVQAAQMREQEAIDRANTLERQLELLKSDLKSQGDVVEWHRAQNVLHLTQAAQSSTAALLQSHEAQLARLTSEKESLQAKLSLALSQDSDHPRGSHGQQSGSHELLRENSSQRQVVMLLESRVGELLAEVASRNAECMEAQQGRVKSEQELLVLQRALQQMAQDLQGLQRLVGEQKGKLEHLLGTKIPKMRLQRSNLALACQRANETIQELQNQLQGAQKGHTLAVPQQRSSSGTANQPSSSRKPSAQSTPRTTATGSSTHAPAAQSASASSTAPTVAPVPIRGGTTSSDNASAPVVQRAANASPEPDYADEFGDETPAVAAAAPQQAAPAASTHANEGEPTAASDAYATPVFITPTVPPASDPQPEPIPEEPPATVVYTSTPAHTSTAPATHDAAPHASSDHTTAVASDPVSAPEPAVPFSAAADTWFDPSGTWVRYLTDDGEAYYYYNNLTQESVWFDPLQPNHSMQHTAETDPQQQEQAQEQAQAQEAPPVQSYEQAPPATASSQPAAAEAPPAHAQAQDEFPEEKAPAMAAPVSITVEATPAPAPSSHVHAPASVAASSAPAPAPAPAAAASRLQVPSASAATADQDREVSLSLPPMGDDSFDDWAQLSARQAEEEAEEVEEEAASPAAAPSSAVNPAAALTASPASTGRLSNRAGGLVLDTSYLEEFGADEGTV